VRRSKRASGDPGASVSFATADPALVYYPDMPTDRETLRSVSAVVPVYNSEPTLPELVTRLRAVLSAEAVEYEIILVNDGSRDRSWDIVRDLAREHGDVVGISLARNHGQHNALLCGIREARGAVIVTLDDDLQNRPEDVPTLLARIREGYDVVYAVPQRQHWGLMRNVAARVTKLVLQNAMGASTASMIGGFRAFRREVRDAFAGYGSLFVNIDVLLTWGAARFGTVVVTHQPRRAGRSNYTLRALAKHTLNMMTGFSTLPPPSSRSSRARSCSRSASSASTSRGCFIAAPASRATRSASGHHDRHARCRFV
jgi:hypothetical protein